MKSIDLANIKITGSKGGGGGKPEETLTQTITTNGTQTFNPTSGHVYDKAVITTNVQPTLQIAYVTPQTSAQAWGPDPGYDGFDYVDVEAVTSSIDSNITAGNIKKDVTILGVSGSYDPQPVLQSKTTTPTTSSQSIIPDSGYDGLSSVTVDAVTSSIDANITAGNIKKDVAILGVTGTYEGTGGTDYRYQTGTLDETGLAEIGWDPSSIGYANANSLHDSEFNSQYTISSANKALYGVVNSGNITSYKFNNNMQFVPYYQNTSTSLRETFGTYGTYNTTLIGIPILSTSNVTNFERAFSYCIKLNYIPKLDFSATTTLYGTFGDCYNITTLPPISAPNCATMDSICANCYSLKDVNMSSLNNVDSLESAFSTCYSLQYANLDFSNNNKFINTKYCFNDCTSLTYVNFNNNYVAVNNLYSTFSACRSLKELPDMGTAAVSDWTQAFYLCESITSVPDYNYSQATNMGSTFSHCKSLTSLGVMNTSQVYNFYQTFNGCSSLTTIESIDFSGGTSFTNTFGYSDMPNLTSITLTGSINATFNMSKLTAIDYASVKSILTAAAATTNSNAKTLTFNRTMTDQEGELAALVATCTASDKNWTITGLTLE